jgi:hypothetical protein
MVEAEEKNDENNWLNPYQRQPTNPAGSAAALVPDPEDGVRAFGPPLGAVEALGWARRRQLFQLQQMAVVEWEEILEKFVLKKHN